MAEPIIPSESPQFDQNKTRTAAPTAGQLSDGYVLNEVPTSATFNYLFNAWGNWTTWLKNKLALFPGFAPDTTLNIAAAAITPTAGNHAVDNGGGSTLNNIATANLDAGRLLILSCADVTHPITLAHAAGGAGQMHLADGQDYVLNALSTIITFKRVGADWYEVSRAASFADGRKVTVYSVAGSYTHTWTKTKWTADIYGAGPGSGGGGDGNPAGGAGNDGGDGGDSSVGGLSARGGKAGKGGIGGNSAGTGAGGAARAAAISAGLIRYGSRAGITGAPAAGSGIGGAGANVPASSGPGPWQLDALAGGAAGTTGSAGAPGTNAPALPPGAPGAGGGGGGDGGSIGGAGGGGTGSWGEFAQAYGTATVGGTSTIVVGAKGPGGPLTGGGVRLGAKGGDGTDGLVIVYE